MASKKAKKRLKSPTGQKPVKEGRIHIRAANAEMVRDFHAYAARCNTNLSTLVVSYLSGLLKAEQGLTYDAEQI